MAKIHKISFYMSDPNERYETGNDFLEDIESSGFEVHPIQDTIKSETKTFDWDDDVVINYVDCSEADAKCFFDSIK